MVERVRTTYMRLLEVRVLHHYWLDDGDQDVTDPKYDFDSLAPRVKRRRLLEYDVRSILRLEPSLATRGLIAGLGGVFRTSSLGLLVAVPAGTVVPKDASFEFFASPVDPAYAEYTALSLRRTTIVDVDDPRDPEISHRYKEGVPVLSNATGVHRGSGTGIRRYLSAPYPPAGAQDRVETLIDAGGRLLLLVGDSPTSTKDLGTVSDSHVYVHQGDVRAIVAPAGFVGVPASGVEMTPDTPQNVVAVIRIVPITGDDSVTMHIVDENGRPRTPTRVFEVHLRNRWTIWRYRSRSTGAVISTEDDVLPLTHRGNAGPKARPTQPLFEPEFDSGTPRRVARLVSDVYV